MNKNSWLTDLENSPHVSKNKEIFNNDKKQDVLKQVSENLNVKLAARKFGNELLEKIHFKKQKTFENLIKSEMDNICFDKNAMNFQIKDAVIKNSSKEVGTIESMYDNRVNVSFGNNIIPCWQIELIKSR